MIYISVSPLGSKFAKALQDGLQAVGVKAIRCRPHKGDDHQRRGRKVFYVTQQVKDKIAQLKSFEATGVSCPRFTTDSKEVRNLGKTVCARTLVNSTNGRGIIEFNSEETAPPRAPLYTEYIPKKAEYRVHVFNGKVIDIQQKKKKREFDGERDTRVRNMANGYIYTRSNIVPPDGIDSLAVQAVHAVGYQYGAVDIIYNEKRNKCYVLEVNSRPGLMGTTLEKYVNAIKEL